MSSPRIHPTAIISPQAQLSNDVEVGAYCVIEDHVTIGPHTRIFPHAYVSGWTRVGANCQIHPFAVVGGAPQDYAYKNEESYVTIGDGCIIREFATIHRGTQPGSSTVLGSACMIMTKSHVAHNCILGDRVVLANGTECSGHVQIGNDTVISGHCLIHQFVRIGRRVMCTGAARVSHDLPPFFMYDREGAAVGINKVGLRREGFPPETIQHIKSAYHTLYRSDQPFSVALDSLAASNDIPQVEEIIRFMRDPSKRGIAGPPRKTTSVYHGTDLSG